MEKCFLVLFDFAGKSKVQKVEEGSTTFFVLGSLGDQARNSH